MEWAWNEKPASALREQQRLKKINAFFNALGIQYLSEISPYHIEQLKAELKKRNLSKATINRYLAILKKMFNLAIDWELYEGKNPVKKVWFYKEISKKEALSANQIEKILEASKEISSKPRSGLQKVFHDIVLLALNTGTRKSEILNLKWTQIKIEKIEIIGKGDKKRVVPLNETALRIIEKQPKKDKYVFDIPNRNHQDLLHRTINQVRKRAGIDFHFHLLRHTFTTRLVEKGADFVTISELLGHSKLTTSLIYSHTDEDRKKRAVDFLNE